MVVAMRNWPGARRSAPVPQPGSRSLATIA